VATLLIFGGAMAKSAQFPLHIWLPETMEGPTPVSALMHAGLVNAGGFLLNRLAPLYSSSPSTMQVVFVVGTITALLGSTIMLTQNDVKRSLGYSTVGQMGYMTMECGLGAYALAVFHLIAHGIFKATLFMNAGSVIHATRRNAGVEAHAHEEAPPSRPRLPLIVGLAATVLVPLGILVGVHELLGIELIEQPGALVLLFFGWVTASQAALSLLGPSAQGSAKATAVMLLTLFVVVFGYLWAGHAFEQFLYPPGSASAAALTKIELEWRFFYPAIIIAVILILLGWFAAFRRLGRGEVAWMERRPWYEQLYVHVHAGLYLEALYRRALTPLSRAAQQMDRRL
jgi:NADH-quinone oxidoreductase subunit L